MNDKEFKELLKKGNITLENDKCEEAVKVVENTMLEGVKKDMIKAIEKIKSTEEMKEFTLHCAKAALYDYDNLLKDLKKIKDKIGESNE